MTYCCCHETCIIWIHDRYEEKDEWDIQDNETYELMIEWFWMMLFVGASYFEGIQLIINIDRVLSLSFHLIDETGWFEELMKNGERYEKWFECFSFHSSLCCLECLMEWLFQSLCECFQQIHMNWSTSVTTCVGVLWNPHSLCLWMRWKCVREVGWLLNTNPIHGITLFSSILYLIVNVEISCCLEVTDWRRKREIEFGNCYWLNDCFFFSFFFHYVIWT